MSDPSSSTRSRWRRPTQRTSLRSQHQPPRPQAWATLTPAEILAKHPPGRTPPLRVLEVLIKLFNARHTAREKTVSHKTRQERAMFLRRFFRQLREKAGFKTLPDPRNIAHRHIQAMVDVWRREQLAPATVQTYLSFLRGLAQWLNKPGFIRAPAHYGLKLEEYQRREVALRDKSWSAMAIDVEDMLTRISEHDRHVGAQLRVILAFGLRRKEAVMFKPFLRAMPFENTALPDDQKQADRYVKIKDGAKGGRPRYLPLDTPQRLAALALAESVAGTQDGHLGSPDKSLEQNLRHFSYVLARFGLTLRERGATGHGLRHEVMHDKYEGTTGQPSPLRGGGPVPPELDRAARLEVARLAGHGRTKASAAYLGAVMGRRPGVGPTAGPGGCPPSDSLGTAAPDDPAP